MEKNAENQNFILTFGYGNRCNYDTLLGYIQEFAVDILVDVREKPRAWSRKWYGNQIKDFCQENGVEYRSEKTLGNISGKSEWISPDPETADLVLQEIAKANQNRTVLLLCAEMDHKKCHRTDVAKKLQELIFKPIKHLA